MATGTSGQLPDGCECRIDFYLISDEADIEVVVGVGGLMVSPAFNEAPAEPLKLVASLGAAADPLSNIATDWRFMTRAEIKDYKRRQEDGRREQVADELEDEY